MPDVQRQLSLACLLVFGAAVAVLLASDAFEFSWRYQLPALVTLPPAGALGIALVIETLRRKSPAAAVSGTAAPGTGTPATEAQPDGASANGAAIRQQDEGPQIRH